MQTGICLNGLKPVAIGGADILAPDIDLKTLGQLSVSRSSLTTAPNSGGYGNTFPFDGFRLWFSEAFSGESKHSTSLCHYPGIECGKAAHMNPTIDSASDAAGR